METDTVNGDLLVHENRGREVGLYNQGREVFSVECYGLSIEGFSGDVDIGEKRTRLHADFEVTISYREVAMADGSTGREMIEIENIETNE